MRKHNKGPYPIYLDVEGSDYKWLTVWMLVIVGKTKSLEAPQQEGWYMHLKDGVYNAVESKSKLSYGMTF